MNDVMAQLNYLMIDMLVAVVFIVMFDTLSLDIYIYILYLHVLTTTVRL